MKLFTKMFVFLCCISAIKEVCAQTGAATQKSMPVSFDALYPETILSRTLQSLRLAWSMAQDLYDQEYDPEQVRNQWLALYADLNCLQAERTGQPRLSIDMVEYISGVWQYIAQSYDALILEDEHLAGFLMHMRSACDDLIVSPPSPCKKRTVAKEL